jgi:DNA-binding XRE family transcriptional regulator
MSVKELEIDAVRLKKARGERRMQDVAETIGITRQYLWKLETGKSAPSGKILAQLCWLYGKRVEDFTVKVNGHK